MSDTRMPTYSGKTIDPFNPDAAGFDIYDIAAALSKLCRFGGACKDFYSVAQHSVMVSDLCPKKYALLGLLHDASEAYMVDLPTPIKYQFPDYVRAEEKLLAKLLAHYTGHKGPLPPSVKKIDKVVLAWERRDLVAKCDWWNPALPKRMKLPKIVSWAPQTAFYVFLERYKKLTHQKTTREKPPCDTSASAKTISTT